MKKMIVVDDEQIIADGVTNLIKLLDLPVEVVATFYSSSAALAYLSEHQVDLVITDINMPKYDGLALLKRLKQLSPLTQVIILTGFGTLDYATEAMKYGVHYFLQKLSSPSEIKLAVEETLAAAQQLKMSQAYERKTRVERAIMQPDQPMTFHHPATLLLYDANQFAKIDPWLSKLIDPLEETIISGSAKGAVYYLLPNCDEFPQRLIESGIPPTAPRGIIYLKEHLTGPDLNQAYRVGSQALEYQFYFDDLVVLSSEELAKKAAIDHSQHIEGFKQAFQELLQQNDFSQITTLTTAFFADCRQELFPVKYLKFELQQFTEALLNQRGIEQNQVPTELALRLLYANSLEHLRELFFQVIQLVKNKAGISADQDIIANLNLILAEEYSNEELSLRWIAKNRLFLNPEYLGKVFLAKTGRKFSTALTETRIQQGKKLLREGQKIYEVAAAVGFKDNPEYFTRRFKELTGLTPKQYQSQQKG